MIICPEQIRAARAWMDWTREGLAEESGLSPATIRNLEKGKIAPRSIEAVRVAFEKKGFHFHEESGLSRQTNQSKVYEGRDSRELFYEDVLATIREKGGEIGAIFETQGHLARALGVTDYARLERLEQLGKVATVKCLLSDVRQLPLSVPSFQFRATTYDRLNPWASFVYGDKMAIVARAAGMDFTFHVMKDVEIAQDGSKRFASGWDSAVPVIGQSAPSTRLS
jgi:DNA-binding XRE family transcriptional regulator